MDDPYPFMQLDYKNDINLIFGSCNGYEGVYGTSGPGVPPEIPDTAPALQDYDGISLSADPGL